MNQKNEVMAKIQALEVKEESSSLNEEEFKQLGELRKRIVEIYEKKTYNVEVESKMLIVEGGRC